jgi:Uma2 family endonuclease
MSTAQEQRIVSRLTGVTYDEYVGMRTDPCYDGKRMAYLDGELEIMSPEFRHEKGGHRLGHVVRAYCEAFGVEYDEAGSTTFREGAAGQPKGAGNEADESFYLGADADAVVGKETLDLAVDDPPSLWIEVDNTGSSIPRRKLYATLRVPEVWRYQPRSNALWFGRLAGNDYEDLAASVALPGLSPAQVLDMLAYGRTVSASAFARWLKGTWFPGHRQELVDAGAGR